MVARKLKGGSPKEDQEAVAIAFASENKGIVQPEPEPQLEPLEVPVVEVPVVINKPEMEEKTKNKYVPKPVKKEQPAINEQEFINIVEENKKLQREVYRLQSEANVRLPEVQIQDSAGCEVKGTKTKILTLGSGEMRPPRHTFNLEFIDKMILDIKNEVKIVDQDGRNRISSMNSSFVSVKGEIDTRIADMEKAEAEAEAEAKTQAAAKKKADGAEKKGGAVEGEVEKKDESLTSEKTQNFIVKRVKAYQQSIVTYAKIFRDGNMRFYIHSLHKKLKYITKFRELMDLSKESFDQWKSKNPDELKALWSYEDYQEVIAKIGGGKEKAGETLDSVIQELREKIDSVMATYIATYETQRKDLQDSYKNRLASDQIIIMNDQFDKTSAKLSLIRAKLISLYSNEDSIMDIILDSHFITMYVLKAIHFVVILVSLFLTEKIFSEMYMKKVYAENVAPPNLIYMLMIFLAIDFGFILFLLTIMFLLMYIFQKPSKDFIINGELIKLFLIDYFIFVVLLFIILAIVAMYMQSKKYFRYNTEGLRAIRALKDITMPLAGVLLAVPFFTIL